MKSPLVRIRSSLLVTNILNVQKLQPFVFEWNSTFSAFSLIIEGTTEKVLQLMLPLKSIYIINFGFIEHKMYFWTLQRVSSKKNSIYWHHFCHEKKISVDIFRAAPYMLMLVLHKDVLFHYIETRTYLRASMSLKAHVHIFTQTQKLLKMPSSFRLGFN